MNKNVIISTIVIAVIAGAIGGIVFTRTSRPSLSGTSVNYPLFLTASSTTYSVTTSSVRLLATTTEGARIATVIQPINCTNSTASAFLGFGKTAVVNTGLAVTASTTRDLSTYPNAPTIQGALHAVVSAGTCSVLVTEWLQ